ncbi:MAG TPA: hypothetical protein VFB12_28760 [Ktedonobacteraceae bacterium]|nr:hypothetical protein [Ktedonobacteraceae bacterium]
MGEQTYLITFDDVSPVEANQYANELSNALLDATADIIVQRRRDDPRAQDFGATLVLILGTPAAVALTKTITTVIGNWLKMRTGASLTVKTADGEMILRNVTSKQAAQLAQVFLTKP